MMARRTALVGLVSMTIALLSGCNVDQVHQAAAAHGVTLTDTQAEAIASWHAQPRLRPGLNWAALRKCESGGNYRAVNPSGEYRGAYQFDQRTWNANAPAGWSGVRPDAAPPWVQDAAAQKLYDRRGRAPWPHCGRRL